ncbi:MAG: hypothetical protein LBG86_01950, partial [Puniceicoccales bacterium]|nr:hypothetical protein [Puniceicoccales bacterium]
MRYSILLLLLPPLLGISVYFSFRLHWPQLRFLRQGVKNMLAEGDNSSGMSNFAAVATIVGGNLGVGT